MDVTSEELIEAIERHLTDGLERVFRATAEAGADVFAVGKEAVTAFASWDDWRAYGFSQRLKDTQPEFRVRVKLSHSPGDPALE